MNKMIVNIFGLDLETLATILIQELLSSLMLALHIIIIIMIMIMIMVIIYITNVIWLVH